MGNLTATVTNDPVTLFGRALARIRAQEELTLAQVGERVGTPHTTISRYEQGRGGTPRPESLEQIARALSPTGDDRYLPELTLARALDLLPEDYRRAHLVTVDTPQGPVHALAPPGADAAALERLRLALKTAVAVVAAEAGAKDGGEPSEGGPQGWG